MGDFLVLALLAGAAFLAVRSLRRSWSRSGCACCSHGCGGCTGGCCKHIK